MQIQFSVLPQFLSNKSHVVGCDECGYGALCYSLVVCGVWAPVRWSLSGLNDSKKLPEKKRLLMRDKLLPLAERGDISYHIAERSNIVIDNLGVATVLKDAYVECFLRLNEDKSALIIADGTLKFDGLGVDDHQIVSLIKADAQVPMVMAASILGKTYRDEQMKKLDELHPMYGWAVNKGYPTAEHLAAIAQYGPCDFHRMSYAPMKGNKITPTAE